MRGMRKHPSTHIFKVHSKIENPYSPSRSDKSTFNTQNSTFNYIAS